MYKIYICFSQSDYRPFTHSLFLDQKYGSQFIMVKDLDHDFYISGRFLDQYFTNVYSIVKYKKEDNCD